MKKILYSLLTLAAALTVASCQKEPANPDPIYGGKTVETTFTVDLDELPTKAYADGKTADKLLVLVYGSDGLVASQSRTSAEDAVQINNLKANVSVKFVKGQTYDIVFWAQAEDAPFTLDAASGKLTIANEGPANAENRDAFWYVEKGYVATANDKETVTLKRPFAQINVLLAEEFDAGTTSKMTVENMPNVIDLRSEDGDVSGSVTYTFTEAGLDDATFDKKYVSGKNYAYGGMNYILVQKGDDPVSAAVSFTVTCTNDDLGTIEIEKSLTGVPVKRNYRTNITYSPSASRDYTVIVNPAWDGTNDDISADAEANEFTVIVGDSAIENGATITLAANETKTVTVTDVNGMKPTSAVSDDVDVVKVTGEGPYDVEAVADGTANVSFHIDSYTKQDVQGADFAIKVVVGDGIKKAEQSIAWSAATATAKIGAQNTYPTLDAEGAKGDISYESSNTDAATIAADGTITLVAAGETSIKATAAEVTVDGVKYAAAEATYTLTVQAADAPTVTGIAVTTPPTKIEYTVGETFDPAGMVVTATYSDGNTAPVTGYTTDAPETFAEASEEVTITITYESKTATVTVKVSEGETPDEGKTVTEIIALADATEFTAKESLVVAKNARGVVVSDGTNAVLVYNWDNNASSTADLAIGDKITFKGTKKTFNGVPEIDPVTDIVVASSGNTVSYPTATDITSAFDSYAGTTAEFISFTGTIAISGNYTNVNVGGATRQGSVSFPAEALTNGQTALIKGYFNGISGSGGKYVNIIVVSVEPVEVTSSISVADMTVEVGKTKTIQPTVNPSNAVVTYATNSNAISIEGNVITGVAEGTATVTATIAAVAGSYTGSSTTFTVTVTEASSGGSSTTASVVIQEYATAHNWANGTQYSSVIIDDNITVTASGGGNTGKYYTSGNEWRIYQSESPTVSINGASGVTITAVKITYNINATGVLTYGSNQVASGEEVSVSANPVSFSVGNTSSATNGQVKITAIEVTYEK